MRTNINYRKWLNKRGNQQKELKHELETVLTYFKHKGEPSVLGVRLEFGVIPALDKFYVYACKPGESREERKLCVYSVRFTNKYSCESIDGPWIPAIKETIKGWSAELLELKNKEKQKEEQKIQNFRQEWQP